MIFTGQPIPLPLDAGINRCLAHGHMAGEWCERREHCAAHLTIKHDARINAPASYRKCMTDNFAAYLPVDGFPIEDEETCNYPNCTCPFDAPADPNWCARGLKHPGAVTSAPAIVFFPAGSLGEEVAP